MVFKPIESQGFAENSWNVQLEFRWVIGKSHQSFSLDFRNILGGVYKRILHDSSWGFSTNFSLERERYLRPNFLFKAG